MARCYTSAWSQAGFGAIYLCATFVAGLRLPF